MKQRPKPVYKWGAVNYDCSLYETCFDHAFRLHWEFWSCSRCSHNVGNPPGREYPTEESVPHRETGQPSP